VGELATKYEMGQTLWSIHRSAVERAPIVCPACEDGTVELRGERYKCPRCDGKREIRVQTTGWIVGDRGCVGNVRAELKCPDWDETWGDDRVEARTRFLFVHYMLDSTGINSGTLHPEPNVWPTREEAQSECDRRNSP
jgi:hypothetical protein